MHAIIGPNGAGKTTFTNLLSGAFRPSAGRDARRRAECRRLAGARHRAARRRALVPAHQYLLDLHGRAELRASRRRRGKPSVLRLRDGALRETECAKVAHALAAVGLADRADTIAGAMSNGEQRQLEIAMLIAGGGSILILDEPLAGMGPEETRRVVELLRELKSNHTIILIEHDMDAVFAVADTLTVLALGRLIAHGSPQEVRRNEEVISAYLGGHAPNQEGAPA
ncbi:MAG: ATP-binding cassette domain-containing protein [Rhodoblastus sp.]